MTTTLLDYKGDGSGSFPQLLKKIGFDDAFLQQYPISTLVEWGWLRPQFRVVVPQGYFVQGIDAQWQFREKNGFLGTAIDRVWNQEWERLEVGQAFWFLHSFFRPGSAAADLLQQNSVAAGLPQIPEELELPSGRKVRPYVDYFYPWQALALVDVVRAADIFRSDILNTPDVTEQVARLARLVSRPEFSQFKPHEYLDSVNRWGGLAPLMTWLAHYQAMRDYLNSPAIDLVPGKRHDFLRDGAQQLANHLGLDQATIEVLIKDHLLVTAQWWNWGKDSRRRLYELAYPHLQQQIYLAVHWLCLLSGKTLDHYFDLWRYQFKGSQQWAELQKVLPFEYYSVRAKFLEMAPFYLNDFNARLESKFQLEGAALLARVDLIRTRSGHFNRLAKAFKNLHDEMGGNLNDRKPIDFEEHDPLAHYLFVAICAEKCFREELERRGKLILISPDSHGMKKYLRELGKFAGLSPAAIDAFAMNAKTIGKLNQVPHDVIAKITALNSTGIANELALVQAMICCEVARNYFAHHDFLDDKLLSDAESKFLLGGILIAVLTFLGN